MERRLVQNKLETISTLVKSFDSDDVSGDLKYVDELLSEVVNFLNFVNPSTTTKTA